MIGEDAGRPVGYNHSRQIYVQYGAPVDGVINPDQWRRRRLGRPVHVRPPRRVRRRMASGVTGSAWSTAPATTRCIRSILVELNLLFADGSVHFIKESANPLTIVALITRAGGEIISADQY